MQKSGLKAWDWVILGTIGCLALVALIYAFFGWQIFGRVLRSEAAAGWAQAVATVAIAIAVALFDSRQRHREASRAMADRLAACNGLLEQAVSGIHRYIGISQRNPKNVTFSVFDQRELLLQTLDRIRRIDHMLLPAEAMDPIGQAQRLFEKAINGLPDSPEVHPSEDMINRVSSLRQEIDQYRGQILEIMARDPG